MTHATMARKCGSRRGAALLMVCALAAAVLPRGAALAQDSTPGEARAGAERSQQGSARGGGERARLSANESAYASPRVGAANLSAARGATPGGRRVRRGGWNGGGAHGWPIDAPALRALGHGGGSGLDGLGARVVDQGVADAGELSISQRLVPLDLRLPTSFERVYEFAAPSPLGGAGGGFGGAGPGGRDAPTLMARSDAGITAVFPRSSYRAVPGGLMAEVPAGTIFHIGPVNPRLLPGSDGLVDPGGSGAFGSAARERSTLRADLSALGGALGSAPGGAVGDAQAQPSRDVTIRDEQERLPRWMRVAEIIDRVGGASRPARGERPEAREQQPRR